jgi:FkbM family methyltransferase
MYSQLGQDMMVMEFFNNKKNGYFVELGAHDGINFSNTLALERFLDWKGVCIEPLMLHFELLTKNRKCICRNELVSDKDGIEEQFVEMPNDLSQLSGIKDDLTAYNHLLNGIHIIHKMKTKTLTTILDESNAPSIIDFLSLDTEGSEYKILQGIDFQKYNFRFICVEHNFNKQSRSNIRLFLENRNYKFHSENKWDDNYIFIEC